MATQMRALSRTVLALYLLVLLWLVLFKFSLHIPAVLEHHVRAVNLIPFAARAGTRHIDMLGMVLNLVVFVPLGLLLSAVLGNTTFKRKLAYIFWFSVAIEVAQYVFAIGVTDITDVIMNTAGGLLGLAGYSFASGYVDRGKLNRWVVGTVGTLTVLLFAFVVGVQYLHGRYRAVHHRGNNGHEKTFVGVMAADTDHVALYKDAGRLLMPAKQRFND